MIIIIIMFINVNDMVGMVQTRSHKHLLYTTHRLLTASTLLVSDYPTDPSFRLRYKVHYFATFFRIYLY